jgi:hypothetical protein
MLNESCDFVLAAFRGSTYHKTERLVSSLAAALQDKLVDHPAQLNIHSLLGLLGFVEHKVHDDQDGGPEDDLFVPEENLAEMEKRQ